MDSEWERIILTLGGLGAAALLLPALFPKVLTWVVTQLLSYRVVVPDSEAILQIPATSVGLDLPRIVMGVGVLVLIGCVGRVLFARGSQE